MKLMVQPDSAFEKKKTCLPEKQLDFSVSLASSSFDEEEGALM